MSRKTKTEDTVGLEISPEQLCEVLRKRNKTVKNLQEKVKESGEEYGYSNKQRKRKNGYLRYFVSFKFINTRKVYDIGYMKSGFLYRFLNHNLYKSSNLFNIDLNGRCSLS